MVIAIVGSFSFSMMAVIIEPCCKRGILYSVYTYALAQQCLHPARSPRCAGSIVTMQLFRACNSCPLHLPVMPGLVVDTPQSREQTPNGARITLLMTDEQT